MTTPTTEQIDEGSLMWVESNFPNTIRLIRQKAQDEILDRINQSLLLRKVYIKDKYKTLKNYLGLDEFKFIVNLTKNLRNRKVSDKQVKE
jgi:hypothetical protein